MTFNLRDKLDLRSGDGQLYHSQNVQPDMFENCTFEAARETLIVYGYSPPDDEQMRQMVDPGSHTGEPWSVSQRAVAMLAPDLPTEIVFPPDVVAGIQSAGTAGYVIHIGFWCDPQANVPPQNYPTGTLSHAEVVLDDDGSTMGFKNVWPHPDYRLTYDQIRQLYDQGGLLVFKRSISEDTALATTQAEFDQLVTGSNPLAQLIARSQRIEANTNLEPAIKTSIDALTAAVAALSVKAATPPTVSVPASAYQPVLDAINALSDKLAPAPTSVPAPKPPTTTPPVTPPAADPSWGALFAELLRRILGRT